MTNLYHGLVQLTNGNVEKSKHFFTGQIKTNKTDELAQKSYRSYAKIFLGLLEGNTQSGAATRFELKGYNDANFVCVMGLNYIPIVNLLKKTKDGWAADFSLPPGKHHYAFLVDGLKVLDPANPQKEEIDTEDGKMILNVKVVK